MAEAEGWAGRLVDFFVDSKHGLSKRLGFFVLIVIGIILFDNYMGFTDYYAFEHKVDQVTKLEAMMHRPDVDTTIRKQLQKLELDILSRKSWIAQLPSWKSLTNKTSTSKFVQPQNANKPKIITVKLDPTWHIITSAWPIIIVMILVFFSLFSKPIEAATIAGLIFFELVLSFLVYGVSTIFSFIPIISETPAINYFLNFSLAGTIAYLIGYGANKLAKRPANPKIDLDIRNF